MPKNPKRLQWGSKIANAVWKEGQPLKIGPYANLSKGILDSIIPSMRT